MATTLAPVDSREVVRCDHVGCNLVQFRAISNRCRRCHVDLDEQPAPSTANVIPIDGNNGSNGNDRRLNLAGAVRNLRLGKKLSQRQLALRMSVPRTYVSKIENENTVPTLNTLGRVAKALEVSIPELLAIAEEPSRQVVREFMEDPFLSELLPIMTRLNGMQMSTILARVREMSAQQARNRVVR